jgi:hypothetical protein
LPAGRLFGAYGDMLSNTAEKYLRLGRNIEAANIGFSLYEMEDSLSSEK